MASNDPNEDKPNLRPVKRANACGKSIFLHHNPKHPSNKSYIHAVWNNANDDKTKSNNADRQDPLGISQPHVEYSLNKRQRWRMLNDFRTHLADASSSSFDSDLDVQSDSEQHKKVRTNKKKKPLRRDRKDSQTKFRVCERHNIDQQATCVSITTNTGPKRTQLPKQTYMQDQQNTSKTRNQEEHNLNNQDENNRQQSTVDVTYYAVVPPPKAKQLANVRKHHVAKVKKSVASVQRSKFTQVKEHLDAIDLVDEDENNTSEEDNQPITPTYVPQEANLLQLNDFIGIARKSENASVVAKTESTEPSTKFDPKGSHFYVDAESLKLPKKFHRQISREEKLYQRDKAVYLQQKKTQGIQVQSNEKSPHHLMSASFRSILVDKNDLTTENLSKTFGKNFIQAQCHPTKYLICLTDRLKSNEWLHKFNLFPTYATLNSYLLIILNDETSDQVNYYRVQVALNMDLYADTIEIENVYESTASIYRITDLYEKVIQFVTTLPFDIFKPIDHEISRKNFTRNHEDSELSDSEFINKQIRHLQLLDNNHTQTIEQLNSEQLNDDSSIEGYDLLKPDICTNCYQDMNETTPMTALKACAHWLCDDCWKQYLESSIKRVHIVVCPEWNCSSIVDVGTLLSLVNVRSMTVYERNIEKCLVNLSRSHVKCPSKSCTNIVEVINSRIDDVRCRCGYRFCIDCKQEAHFPANCNAHRLYLNEVHRNGDLISEYNAVTEVKGRNCISCHNFIEKNGGCNHMTCSCGAEFCWTCTGYWKDHNTPDGTFRCPKEAVPLQEEILAKKHNQSRRFYYNAVMHRHQRILRSVLKQQEHAKRLLGTIPLEKGTIFNSTNLKSQIDKRESALRHLYEMAKYIDYLHYICEFVAVAAEGYGNNPCEFRIYLQPLESIVFNIGQVLEGGRGYKAIEQLNQLHTASEKIIERMRRAVSWRELRRKKTAGYITS